MTSSARACGIRFENIDKRYGNLYALKRVSLAVNAGECVVLAGRNGSGKTTLLRVAAGLVRPTAGQVRFTSDNGASAVGTPPLGFVAHATMLYEELTAEENLQLFARLLGVEDPGARVDYLLREVGLSDRRASQLRTFSRGMRQRVAIGRALLHDPGLLLLDEPATGLDPAGTLWLAGRLRQLCGAGCTILMSLHGESALSALATRAVRLENGALVADTSAGAGFQSVLALADA